MRKIFFLFIIIYGFSLHAQEYEGKKSLKTEIIDDGSKLHVNDFAKDFNVKMLNGENIYLSNLKGKVVLLNFWATWCVPCLKEFLEIPDKLLKPFSNSNFIFLPISRGESEDKVTKKMQNLKKNGIDFNVGIDPDKKIWDLYATHSIPRTFLIDQKGVIKFISIGYTDDSLNEIISEIEKLLKN